MEPAPVDRGSRDWLRGAELLTAGGLHPGAGDTDDSERRAHLHRGANGRAGPADPTRPAGEHRSPGPASRTDDRSEREAAAHDADVAGAEAHIRAPEAHVEADRKALRRLGLLAPPSGSSSPPARRQRSLPACAHPWRPLE